ncbi:tRNA pseudouridine(38-40) synthase TruA [Muribaculum intestinale]|uniref:tRNA pseudouridine(38-40) synthase TruA n=1 Tax=Muribaculum intestinale TaxID=1796646 RepID=UPI00242DD066|nr:tRNA pseudouridine(38-40) synthase TruA [Muribaculum intestinale]
MKLAYRGAPYHGWQIQPNAVSVQESVEKALSTFLREPTPVVGAGRTDTGVNASMMMAHFDTCREIADRAGMVRALCSMLGPDIAVYDIIPVHDDAHARFDAVSRTYHYYTYSGRSPFLYALAWQEPVAGLDFDAMNRAASMLLEVDDFTSFAKLHSDAKTNICRVTRAEWIETVAGDSSRHTFVITADRFLRNMVRAVVGTLVDVGRGKLTVDGFRKVIDSRDRCAAGTSMPPHPLFLHDIRYPYL